MAKCKALEGSAVKGLNHKVDQSCMGVAHQREFLGCPDSHDPHSGCATHWLQLTNLRKRPDSG